MGCVCGGGKRWRDWLIFCFWENRVPKSGQRGRGDQRCVQEKRPQSRPDSKGEGALSTVIVTVVEVSALAPLPVLGTDCPCT